MYLIDAYNLYYATNFANVDEFIAKLDELMRVKKKRAKLIFDGFSPYDLSTQFLQVEFVGDADQAIAEIMQSCNNASSYTLVSSDKELKYIARQCKVKIINSEDFNFALPEKTKVEAGEEEDFFLTDSEVQEQLKEFNNFQK